MKKHKNIVIVIVHVALWICFIALPFIFFPDLNKELPEKMSQRIIVGHLFVTVLLVPFYYFNTQILIPTLLFKARWWLYSGIVTACFIAFLYTPKFLTDVTLGPREEPKNEIRRDFLKKDSATVARKDNFKPQQNQQDNNPQFRRGSNRRNNPFRFYPPPYTVFLLVFTIGTCIAVMQRWLYTERTNQEIQNEKLNTELSFLKSQVNPHFFFNTLNNIYSLAVVGSDQTATAILKLSSIMRYILTETQVDKVTLSNEVDFIKNFIDLQLVRLTDKVKINFSCEGFIEQQQVAPLLFITFIENAFKYGVSTKEKTAITINLLAEENSIRLYVANTMLKANNGIQHTTGIGITNVKRRLELLYPNRHSLEVTDNSNQFIVQLHIQTS